VSELTVQVHSRAPLIATLPDPPAGGKEFGDVVAAIAHFVALGAVVVTTVDEPQPVTHRAMKPRAAGWNRMAIASANELPRRSHS
jgi:hypothetical protein